MEQQSKDIEEITRNLLKEAGLNQPSPSFGVNVMAAIEAKSQVGSVAVKPLISRGGWILLSTIFTCCIGLLYFFPIDQMNFFPEISISEIKIENPLKGVALSKTTIYAVGFLSLFLVQIPFLKHRFSKLS